MSLRGHRKLLMTAGFVAVIIFAPNLDAIDRGRLLEVLIYAAFVGNGAEHVVEGFKNGKNRGGRLAGAISSVRPVSAPPESRGNQGAH